MQIIFGSCSPYGYSVARQRNLLLSYEFYEFWTVNNYFLRILHLK